MSTDLIKCMITNTFTFYSVTYVTVTVIPFKTIQMKAFHNQCNQHDKNIF